MAVGGVELAIMVDIRGFCKALDELGHTCGKAVAGFDGLLACLRDHGRPKYSGPGKLCIDGREYHRRQRRRVKRRR